MNENEIILLGAGASKEANIPDSCQMTKAIIEKFNEIPKHKQYERIANYVIGGLLFEEGKRGKNPQDCNINVEDFFNSILLLAERDLLEVTPFISSWHPMVEEFDQVIPSPSKLNKLIEDIVEDIGESLSSSASNESKPIEESLYYPTFSHSSIPQAHLPTTFWIGSPYSNQDLQGPSQYSVLAPDYVSPSTIHGFSVNSAFNKISSPINKRSNNLDQLGVNFQQAIRESQPKPAKGGVFREMADLMIQILTDILWIDKPLSVAYLNPLVNLASNGNRLIIATLNYDNSIELAASSQSIPLNIGIEKWSQNGFFDTKDNCVHLLKLHGSIDWAWRRNDTTDERPLPYSPVERVGPKEIKNIRFRNTKFKPAVLFGHKNKLTAKGPFLDLLRAFKKELMENETRLLTVIGYSFGDDHINTYISQWLYQDPRNCIRIVDPGFNKNTKDFALRLKTFKNRKPKQVKVFNLYAGKAIKRFYGSN